MPEPTTDPRAAQIEAVRGVMGLGRTTDAFNERAVAETAAELVDAVHAGGRDDQGDTRPATWNITAWRCACHPNIIWGIGGNSGPILNAGDGPRRWYGIGDWAGTLAAESREFATVDDLRAAHGQLTPIGVDNVAAVLADLREARQRADQGEVRRWAAAVAALRDDEAFVRWWRETGPTTVNQAAADYLEAVGPDGTPAPDEEGNSQSTVDSPAARRCPRCGKTRPLGAYDLCTPCVIAEGWEEHQKPTEEPPRGITPELFAERQMNRAARGLPPEEYNGPKRTEENTDG